MSAVDSGLIAKRQSEIDRSIQRIKCNRDQTDQKEINDPAAFS